MSGPRGMVAAGHPVTAEAGAQVLRAGGNAVDAAIASVLASWAAEPLLTGPGAGGYLLVAGAGEPPTLLDFFVEAPGRGADLSARGALVPVDVSFGDVVQVFHVGAASCGVPGNPAGVAQAADRWARMSLTDLAAPAARLARDGVAVNAEQAYVFEILEPILVSTPESRAVFAPEGRVLRQGDLFRDPQLADTIDRLGAEGAEPFYRGDLAAEVAEWVVGHGGLLTTQDLAAYRAVPRDPVRARYRGRTILTNPPPSAGGILLALAMALLDARTDGPPTAVELVEVMAAVQEQRTPAFTTGLAEEGFADALSIPPNTTYAGAFRAAVAAARTARKGLWGACTRFGEPVASPP
jgi:gamma-glutamyltranspeptidase/glutathione hydrolase